MQETTEPWQELLGVYTDAYISRAYNLKPHVVRRIRLRKGLPRGNKGRKNSNSPLRHAWSTVRGLLGVETDTYVAELLGCSRERVRQVRNTMSIPRPPKRKKNGPPPPDFSAVERLLGVLPDRQIARQLGCAVEHVAAHRKKRNISRAPPPRYDKLDWTAVDPLLGVLTDVEIAERMGCAKISVGKRRKKFGIPRATYSRSNFSWEDFDSLLGTASDTILAHAIGCSAATVYLRRKRLGVKPYPGKGGRRD